MNGKFSEQVRILDLNVWDAAIRSWFQEKISRRIFAVLIEIMGKCILIRFDDKKCLHYLTYYGNIPFCDKFLATLLKSVARDQKEVTIA